MPTSSGLLGKIQAKLSETHPLLAQSLSRTCGIDIAGETLVFRFPPTTGLFADRFKDPEIMPALRAACEAALGRSVAPRVEIDPNAPTPKLKPPAEKPRLAPVTSEPQSMVPPPTDDDIPHHPPRRRRGACRRRLRGKKRHTRCKQRQRHTANRWKTPRHQGQRPHRPALNCDVRWRMNLPSRIY